MKELAAVMNAQQQSEAPPLPDGMDQGSANREGLVNGPADTHRRRRLRPGRSRHAESECSVQGEQAPMQVQQQQQQQKQELQGVQQHWLWPSQWFCSQRSGRAHRTQPTHKQYGQCSEWSVACKSSAVLAMEGPVVCKEQGSINMSSACASDTGQWVDD